MIKNKPKTGQPIIEVMQSVAEMELAELFSWYTQ